MSPEKARWFRHFKSWNYGNWSQVNLTHSCASQLHKGRVRRRVGEFTRMARCFEWLHGIEAYSGTEIGWIILEKALKRMGDSVRVQSQLGQGSRSGVKVSRLVQYDTSPMKANELKSPRLKLS